MDKRTLTALRGSIEKWRLIAEGVGEDMGVVNCPLCKKFNDIGCHGCPVSNDTGHDGCRGTPWDAWLKVSDFAAVRTAKGEKEKLLALNEYVYLLSLLPEGVYE